MKRDYLYTERLEIIVVTPQLYKYVFENYTDKELMLFFGFRKETELQEEKLKFALGNTTHRVSFVYFMIKDRETSKVIGSAGFHTWYVKHDRAEIGYALHANKYKRKGIMSEAMKVILEYGFKKMKLHRVEALVSPENTASRKLLEKFSFQQEGVLTGHYLVNGVYEDSLLYSLIKAKR
jgi:ribosomal-protein-alanine N-acetyltransferase